jgi:hypothetical protein
MDSFAASVRRRRQSVHPLGQVDCLRTVLVSSPSNAPRKSSSERVAFARCTTNEANRSSAYRLEHSGPGVAMGTLVRYIETICLGFTRALAHLETRKRVHDLTADELRELDFWRLVKHNPHRAVVVVGRLQRLPHSPPEIRLPRVFHSKKIY